MPDPAGLTALREVIEGPLREIADRFSRFLADGWPHQALVIFTRECTGRPRKVTGTRDITDKVTIAELEALKANVPPGRQVTTTATLGGAVRTVWAVQDPIGTLLVLVPRSSRARFPHPAPLAGVFGIVATSIRQQVTQASPDYLAESRAASSERARTIAEMAAAHETALVTILTTLRSSRLDDHRARLAATDTASAALVALRSAQKTDLAQSEEPMHTAFARLRREIRQMLRHHDAQLDFAAPPKNGRPIPGEIAHAARAMTCTAVLTFTSQPELTRLRVAWSSDSTALHLDVRDQGSGSLDSAGLRLQLDGRAKTLGATVEIDTLPGWGSHVAISVPFDPAGGRPDETLPSTLNRRELEVLRLVAQGQRNKTIAGTLGITESTVKFHVTGLLKKLGVTSRGEAAALALSAGITGL
ncbi:regulatory protein, luxR family [Amycolatopsis lurida]|uniref:LuxR family transcriptional regulator n=1 Tax=Amycolatopsis lurida NRRL 2430 TaxID=1460371 RepID=A0A2P2FU92_AMYLU|nr:LuxR C-terminal-related transcriptional regulator [Amycolatopsis lurida]KFU80282.1 LuxR family transcriptional regulator [Amycolatopsis lurida NRRL 2430]SEE54259.1 regulatory protein, luxR family [Amycolatopsis lurida]